MITFIAALMTSFMAFGAYEASQYGLPLASAVIIGLGTWFVYQLGHLDAYRIMTKDNNE